MAAPAFSIQMLGGFRVIRRGSPIVMRSTRVQLLLAYLVLHKSVPQRRVHLASLFWPDSTDAQARTNLRKLALELRHAIPGSDRCVCDEGAALMWREDAPCAVDVLEFERTVREASSTEAMEHAATLYRGELLPGCYEDWVLAERERLRQLYSGVLERLVGAMEARESHADAIRYGHRLLDQDPLREETYRMLMRLHVMTGDRAGAVRFYHRCEAVLGRELDVTPSPATREAYARVLHADTKTPEEAAPSTPSALHNLPRHLTTFVGRGQELVDVTRLLAGARLLTLRGAAGCGKSRLALRLAADLAEDYPDGVWFVELAPLSDPALVARAVAAALRVAEQPGEPLAETLSNFLREKRLLLVLDNCEHLAEACANLIVTLLGVCPSVRVLATSRHALRVPGEILWRVPPLSLPDPDRGPPAPAKWLPPEALLEYDAVRLFVERTAAVQPAFRLTPGNAPAAVDLCRRLDGLPLAIELAAARMKVLTVHQITTRLGDRFNLLAAPTRTAPARHRTLAAAVAWSHDLLSEQERSAFRRLSMFAGGWTLEAGEAVCAGDGPEATEVLDLLAELVDKSLVIVDTHGGEARYRMLETVRQYARDRLEESGEAESIVRRHRDWCVALAERAGPHVTGPDQDIWLNRLENEHANVRAALRWALDQGEVEASLRLASALRYFWARRGYFAEGRSWLEEGLRSVPAVLGAVRINALNAAGQLAAYQGDFGAAQTFLAEGLALSREHGDQRGLIRALVFLGYTRAFRGECEQARALLEESLALSRRLGSGRGTAYSLAYLAITASQQGDYPGARVLQQRALAAFRELGDRAMIAMTLHNLGHVISCQGEHAAARPIFEESLSLFRALRDRRGVVYAITNLGIVAVHEGDLPTARDLLRESLTMLRDLEDKRGVCRALEGCGLLAAVRSNGARTAKLLGAAQAVREAIGMPLRPNDRGHYKYDRYVATMRRAIGDDAFEAVWTQGRAMTLGEAIDYALDAEAASSPLPAERHDGDGIPQSIVRTAP